jgi:hypothetical protein
VRLPVTSAVCHCRSLHRRDIARNVTVVPPPVISGLCCYQPFQQSATAISFRVFVNELLLPATLGHLNEAISRRNRFWASMGILYSAIADETQHFDVTLLHNFRSVLK